LKIIKRKSTADFHGSFLEIGAENQKGELGNEINGKDPNQGN